jgi:putative ABC transport system substrate-binding protein
MPLVGVVTLGTPEGATGFIAAFREGLGETGFIEGRNLTFEYRFARNEFDRLPEWMADIVSRRAAVIVTSGYAAAFAAKAATTTIPIVFSTGGNPVQAGLVASLNRPGGNITGATSLVAELGAKRMGLLHELIPAATRFAVLVNPTSPNAQMLIAEAQSAGAAIGREVEIVTASNANEIDAAFAILAQRRVDGLVINGNTFFSNRRAQIATLAAHHRLPTIYSVRAIVESGGLMSYGTINDDSSRQVGVYTGRILKGEKPADLPVVQGAKFQFVINLRTAKTLGLVVPPTLLALADEVIE